MNTEIKTLKNVTVENGRKIIFTIKYAERINADGKPYLLGCAGSFKVEHREAA